MGDSAPGAVGIVNENELPVARRALDPDPSATNLHDALTIASPSPAPGERSRSVPRCAPRAGRRNACVRGKVRMATAVEQRLSEVITDLGTGIAVL